MLITVQVANRLEGLATSGNTSSSSSTEFVKLTFDDSQPIKHIIKKYCEVKDIQLNPIFCLFNEENKPFPKQKRISTSEIQNDEKLYIGFVDPFQNMRFSNWFSIAAIALLIGIVGIAICTCIYVLLRTSPANYAIVFDAGSTHTETLLYSWPSSKINNTGSVIEIHSCSIQDGIANVVLAGIQSVAEYVGKCFEEERQRIPPESSKETEIFFGGTAGLRLLYETNESYAIETMNKVKEYLSSSEFKYDETHVEILPGSKEGVSGWVTVNYLNQRLRSGEPSQGALDMGGASTQISFEVPSNFSNLITPSDDGNTAVMPVNLYGHEFKVFSKSFLCYGLSQAKLRYTAALLLQQVDKWKSVIQSPCESIGKTVNLTSEAIFNSACTSSYSGILRTPKEFRFEGSSDPGKCHQTLQYLLSSKFCRDMNINDEKCINVDDIPAGYQAKSFQAFSGFGHVNKQLKLKSTSTKSVFESTVFQRCQFTYDELISEYTAANNSKVKLSFLDELCFKGLYIYTLLSSVYKFETEEKWRNVEFNTEASGVSLGWALGYMVNATESIKSIPPIPSLNVLSFSLLTIVFVVFIIVGLAFILHAIQMRRFLHYYQKITLSA